MSRSKIRLSQCMIVKDEEKNIRKALSWGKSIVDEQIVVDTGSADQTADIAKEMGAKVFSYSWDDDFSAAKNYALQQAKGDWIAFLDADEWISEQDVKKILPLLKKIHRQDRYNVIQVQIANLDKEGNVTTVAPQWRFFRNDPHIRYQNRIHEELYDEKNGNLNSYNAGQEVMILHTGYAEDEALRKRKGQRNVRILLKQLEEKPEDRRTLMYLGDAYTMAGEQKEAECCYEKVLWDTETAGLDKTVILRAGLQLFNSMIASQKKESEEKLSRICSYLRKMDLDDHPDVDFLEGMQKRRSGDVQGASRLYERALSKMDNYKGAEMMRITAGLRLVCSTIAQAALENQEEQKAVQYATAALRIDKYSADALNVLLNAFLTEWKEGMSIDPYWNFLCKIYEKNRTEDLQFLCKAAKESGFQRLEEHVLALLSQNDKETDR